jgi:uncharacterized protein
MGDMAHVPFLKENSKLLEVINDLEDYLTTSYPEFFGEKATRPIFKLKRAKVIHDNLWGTIRYSWQELALLDTPLLQRLRDIHQVGLAFHIYPSARHSRFEHTLGVVAIASKTFDALFERNRGLIRDIARNLGLGNDLEKVILQIKQELRLAALLHDVGHSLFSHASERVYKQLALLQAASKELSKFVGKEKGEGEVISFCLALTPSIANFLQRAGSRELVGELRSDDFDGVVSMTNIALLIVGRSRHPHLQFLGDIISSELDSDKLDYLLRDATAAGLPLRYDLDMYLYSVQLDPSTLTDGEGILGDLYATTQSSATPDGVTADGTSYFDTYRLRLPRRATHVIEQIVLCKLMLFSYMYHHTKIRAAEGLLENTLKCFVDDLINSQVRDADILKRFMHLTDSAVFIDGGIESNNRHIKNNLYRLRNRLLPREVYRLSASAASGAQKLLLSKFLLDLQNRSLTKGIVEGLEKTIGDELVAKGIEMTARDALLVTGIWVDVPKPPKFERTRNLVLGTEKDKDVKAGEMFPIGEWQHAYTHYRYHVRIFAFSEFVEVGAIAARTALKLAIGIEDPEFYNKIRRYRSSR